MAPCPENSSINVLQIPPFVCMKNCVMFCRRFYLINKIILKTRGGKFFDSYAWKLSLFLNMHWSFSNKTKTAEQPNCVKLSLMQQSLISFGLRNHYSHRWNKEAIWFKFLQISHYLNALFLKFFLNKKAIIFLDVAFASLKYSV